MHIFEMQYITRQLMFLNDGSSIFCSTQTDCTKLTEAYFCHVFFKILNCCVDLIETPQAVTNSASLFISQEFSCICNELCVAFFPKVLHMETSCTTYSNFYLWIRLVSWENLPFPRIWSCHHIQLFLQHVM